MGPKKNFLVIGGGVGPAAGVAFHQKIVEITDNEGLGDQGHPPVIHLSMSPYVLDRTKFLLDNPDGQMPNPGENMGLAVRESCRAFQGAANRFIIGVPCNTFHSPAVYHAYEQMTRIPRVTLVNMIAETAEFIKGVHGGRKIILISTRGTRNTRVYDQYFGGDTLIRCDNGQDKIEGNPNDKIQSHFISEDGRPNVQNITNDQQGAVMAAIYDPDQGVKGSRPNWGHAKTLFETVVGQLMRGAGIGRDECCVIMGCTEIPLAYKDDVEGEFADCVGGVYVDPMDLLAQKMVTLAGYKLTADVRHAAEPLRGDIVYQKNKEIAEGFTRNLSQLRAKL